MAIKLSGIPPLGLIAGCKFFQALVEDLLKSDSPIDLRLIRYLSGVGRYLRYSGVTVIPNLTIPVSWWRQYIAVYRHHEKYRM
jgi:hypothetical protein